MTKAMTNVYCLTVWLWLRRMIQDQRPVILLSIIVVTLPISVRSLDSFFTFDDLMNIDYYSARPVQAMLSNLVVLTSFHRPSGALLYLPLYYCFGMQSFYYYLFGFLLYYINCVLLFVWTFRLTRNRLITLLSVTLVVMHPTIHNVLFNFGAIFDLLTMAAILLVLLFYKSFADRPGRRLWYVMAFACYLFALNSKETAVVVPAVLFFYELFYLKLWKIDGPTLLVSIRRLVPYVGVALPYTFVKTLGDEAYGGPTRSMCTN